MLKIELASNFDLLLHIINGLNLLNVNLPNQYYQQYAKLSLDFYVSSPPSAEKKQKLIYEYQIVQTKILEFLRFKKKLCIKN